MFPAAYDAVYSTVCENAVDGLVSGTIMHVVASPFPLVPPAYKTLLLVIIKQNRSIYFVIQITNEVSQPKTDSVYRYTYSLDLVHQRCTVTVPVVLACVSISDLRTATGWEWGGVCCSH